MIEYIEMEKTPKSFFQTQFDQELPKELQRTSCGIAALYMAMRYFSATNEDFASFTRRYIQLGSYNRPTYAIQAPIGGKSTDIPILYASDGNNVQQEASNYLNSINPSAKYNMKRIDSQENGYQPAHTLKNGFDHRGVRKILENTPLISEVRENAALSEITSQIQDPNTIALLSVRHNDLGYPIRYHINHSAIQIPTHVVCAFNAHTLGGTTSTSFCDPAFPDEASGVQVRSTEALDLAFAGTATLIKLADS